MDRRSSSCVTAIPIFTPPLRRAVTTRIGPGPTRRLVNLDHIMSWVRDGDPDASGSPDATSGSAPGGGPPTSTAGLNQDVFDAFHAFSEDWAATLAAIQAGCQLLMSHLCRCANSWLWGHGRQGRNCSSSCASVRKSGLW